MESTFPNVSGPVISPPVEMTSSTSKPTRTSESAIISGVTESGISTNSFSQDKGARI